MLAVGQLMDRRSKSLRTHPYDKIQNNLTWLIQ